MSEDISKIPTVLLIQELLRRFQEMEVCNQNLMSQLKIALVASKGTKNENQG